MEQLIYRIYSRCPPNLGALWDLRNFFDSNLRHLSGHPLFLCGTYLIRMYCHPGWKGPCRYAVSTSIGGYNADYPQIYMNYWSFNVWSRPNAWVQVVQKLTMMAFRRWSKHVAGNTLGCWSLVTEGSNAHGNEVLLSFRLHWKKFGINTAYFQQ